MPIQQMLLGVSAGGAGEGQETFPSAGTYSWTCPSGIASVSVVCIGAGGAGSGSSSGSWYGGGGGACAYKNQI